MSSLEKHDADQRAMSGEPRNNDRASWANTAGQAHGLETMASRSPLRQQRGGLTMPTFEFTRIERVIATWTVEAATIEEAREKWEQQHSDVHLHGEEVTDVFDAWWEDEAGKRFGETAEDDETGDDVCPNCGRDYPGDPLAPGEECLCKSDEACESPDT